MQPALSVDQQGQTEKQARAGREIDFSLSFAEGNGQSEAGGPERAAAAFAQTHGFPVRPSPVAFAPGSDSEDFKAAARAGMPVLSFLVGRSIGGLAKDIALYRRTWAECGHAGSGTVAVVVPALVGEGAAEIKRAARDAMSDHLQSHPSLLREAAWDFPPFLEASEADGISLESFLDDLSGERLDAIIDFAADRYVASHGLFGSQSECLALVERLRQAGVDEIACQIDFACSLSVAIEHLPKLDELRRTASPFQPLSEPQVERPLETSSNPPRRPFAPTREKKLAAPLAKTPRRAGNRAGGQLFRSRRPLALGCPRGERGSRSRSASVYQSKPSWSARSVNWQARSTATRRPSSFPPATTSPKGGRLTSSFKNRLRGDRFQDRAIPAER